MPGNLGSDKRPFTKVWRATFADVHKYTKLNLKSKSEMYLKRNPHWEYETQGWKTVGHYAGRQTSWAK